MDSFFKASWLHFLKFKSFGIVGHIGKNSKQKEVENDSKHKLVKNLVKRLKNANSNVVVML